MRKGKKWEGGKEEEEGVGEREGGREGETDREEEGGWERGREGERYMCAVINPSPDSVCMFRKNYQQPVTLSHLPSLTTVISFICSQDAVLS